MIFLKKAKRLAVEGFHVFPLVTNSKKPIITNFPNVATTGFVKLDEWWYNKSFNIGISTTHYKKDLALLVVDVDNKKDKNGSETLLKLEINGSEFPKTRIQKTPTGGLHLIYKVKEPVKQGTDVLGSGLDIRSRGGYILGAGSVLDGKEYTTDATPIVWAPEWMILKCNEKREASRKTKKKVTAKINKKAANKRAATYLAQSAPLAVEGSGGDQTTYRVASKMKDMGVTEKDCFELMIEYWNERCSPPWNLDELQTKINNAYSYGQNTEGSDSPENDFEPVETGAEDEEKPIIKKGKHPVEELNDEYAFIVLGGKSTIIRKAGKDGVEYMSVTAFHDLLKADRIQIGTGYYKQLSEIWMASHLRATYYSVALLPGKKAPPGVFNLWRGFTCEVLKGDPTEDMIEGVRLFKEHALENVCDGDEELFTWLMGYFAHLMQKPAQKPLTALVFKGLKGVGKNALIDRVGNLLGGHYLLTSNKRYITSNFNKHLSNMLLFVLDEAFWSGDKQAEGILKDLITGNKHLIEQKGREMFVTKNVTRICIIGNEEWLVPATQDERRFAVFNIGNKRKNDRPYFRKMRKLIDDKGGNQLLLKYFMDFDLSQVDVDCAPATQGLLDQKIETLNPVHSWWYSSLKEGDIVELDFLNEWPKELDRNLLRNAFCAYAKSRGIRSWLPDSSVFGKTLKKCLPSLLNRRIRKDGERARIYIIPSLEQARNEFEDYIGHEIEWEEPMPSNVIDAVNLFS